MLSLVAYRCALRILFLAGLMVSGTPVAFCMDLGDYKARVLSVDVKHDGPVDRKVQLRITNTISQSVELACHHWTLGEGSWSLIFVSVELGDHPDNQPDTGLAELIADVTKVAEKFLAKDYSSDLVSTIQLQEDKMPEYFSRQIYTEIAAQMRQLNGRAQAAYDQNLKRMLQAAFDGNHCVQLIAKQLAGRGFALTRATPPELTAVRQELAGIEWRKISEEQSAGLKNGSATVIYFDLRHKGAGICYELF